MDCDGEPEFFVLLDHKAWIFGLLIEDNDIDLIVTDVQRRDLDLKDRDVGAIKVHDGVNFIVNLRKSDPDPIIRGLPVLFYAAYDLDRLYKFTAAARSFGVPTEISNSGDEVEIIVTIISLLYISRKSPLRMMPSLEKKKATKI